MRTWMHTHLQCPRHKTGRRCDRLALAHAHVHTCRYVAPLAIATTFGAIYDHYELYLRRLHSAYPHFPRESHYFWAYHVRHVLQMGDAVSFLT